MMFLTRCFTGSVRTLFGLFFLLSYFFTYSQSSDAVISGIIKDSAGNPVHFASISLLHYTDSSLVKNDMGDAEGRYWLKGIKAGQYLLRVSAVGYQPSALISIEVSIAGNYPQNFVLATEDKNLEAVKVVARKPPVQFKADRTILNVASSITASGYNVFDLLAKAPGIRIVNNEDILINGKRGMAVYLDEKQLQLQGQEIISFLQTLPAANIETIEIITHPSARYDAAGNAGIINIRTKKSLSLGFNGSAGITGIATNYKPKIEGSTNLNYRQSKYHLFGTYSYNNGRYRNRLEDTRAQALVNTGPTNFSQHFVGQFPRQVHNYKAGADYFLYKKNTLGFVVNSSISNWLYDRNSTTDIYKALPEIDSQLISHTIQPKKYRTQNYNLNYLYHDSLGHELNIDASYGIVRTKANTTQTNDYVKGLTLLRSNANTNSNEADITIAVIKADYTQKLWKGAVTVGAKGSQVQSDNDLLFYNILNGAAKPDTGRTNHFVYTEKIMAGYVDYNFALGKFDIQTGLRLEHTLSKGDLTTILRSTSEAVDTAYTKLFPNLVINYKLNSNHNLGVAIGRRINRPAYQSLNPFEFVLDELSYAKGNPFLKPQTAYDLKLSHGFKSLINSSISYTIISNYMLGYRDTLSGGRTFASTINAGTEKYYTATSAVQFSPQTWWDVFISGEAFYQTVNGRVNKQLLKQEQFAWDMNASTSFRIGKAWSAEVSGYYNSPYMDAPAIVRRQWSVDAGIQRKILKDAGSLRFNATDIFGSLNFSLDRNFGGLYYRMQNRWESRQYRFTFSYKFGNQRVKASRKQNSSAAEEQQRAGSKA